MATEHKIIKIMRGLEVNFIPTNLLPGVLHMTTDTGKIHFCYAAGNIKQLATVEQLQELLNASPEAYIALQQLITELEDETVLTGLLADIAALYTQLAQKANQTALNETNLMVALKADKSEVTNVMTPKGTLDYASLPTIGNTVGWYYYCPDGDGTHGAGNYVWNGASWFFGGTGDEGYNLLKGDLDGIKYGDESVNRALCISEKLYNYLYGKSEKTWTPSYAGSYASMTGSATLENGKKYIGIVECNDVSYFDNFGLLQSGSWYKSSLGGFNNDPENNIAWIRFTPDKDNLIPAILVGQTGVGKECAVICKVYEIESSVVVTKDFALKIYKNDYKKLSYEQIVEKFSEIDKNSKEKSTWYKDKVLTCYGDSWTAQDTFRTRLLNYFGFSLVNNCGVGGTRLTGNGNTALPSDERINTIPLNSDVITILGGANDAVYGTIGSGQINFATEDLNSVSGALNVILSKIYYKFRMTENGYYDDINYSNITRSSERKDVKIFIATCCGRYDGTNFATYARMISDGTRSIANLHSIPVIDIARESGINDMNYAQYLSDSVHPNDVGDAMVTNVIINTMLVNEPHDTHI